METTAKSIGFVKARWNLARILVLALLSLTFILLLVSVPEVLILPAVSVSVLGVLFGAWALLKASKVWARAALIAVALLFSLSMTIQLALGSILYNLPVVLLAYLIILFLVEAFDLLWKDFPMHSRQMWALQASHAIPAIEKSLQHMFRKFARVGLMLGACYFSTLAAVSFGSFFASISPLASDTSIYIVAVSISLALLLILRED
jgi:hypothetical protein